MSILLRLQVCECAGRAPTFPVFRDFEHFPECPLAPKPLAEIPIGDRVLNVFGPSDYWRRRAIQEMRNASDWESRYLRRNEEFNQMKNAKQPTTKNFTHKNKNKNMTKLTYGDGLLKTQQGNLADGTKCLTITKNREPKPINSTPRKWEKQVDEESVDCILAFKNLESARTLQDELNELIAIWSREQGQVVD